MTKHRLTQRLESTLGSDAVLSHAEELTRHRVDGKQPTAVCLPADVDQVAAALRLCTEADAGVAPWGGGTAIRVGNLPRCLDAVIRLQRLDDVVEHDHANLTATVGSGMTLHAVQGLLAREKQFLPWDIPFPASSTIGGIVAANLNGFRRHSYGGVRDRVIGMKVVLTTGEQIKAGGKVVKNVAGYDVCKLFVGSLGTLGIITEVTFRVAPIPHDSATFMACGPLPLVSQLLPELGRSVCQPAAVVLVNSAAHKGLVEEWALAIRTDGLKESNARQLQEFGAMVEPKGLRTVLLRDRSHDAFWNDVRDFPLQADHLVYRVNVPGAAAGQVVKAVHEWKADDCLPAIASDTLAGVVWVALPVEQAKAATSKLTALAQEYSGHAVLFAGPPKAKETIDVWGPAPPSLPIMKQIKRQFDPQGILNPGRFLAGI